MRFPLNDKEQPYSKILKLIQPVLDSVSEMQGLWLKFVDTSGEYILTSRSTSPCKFCWYIRSTRDGLSRCHQSARLSVAKSRQRRGPVKMCCHAGLTSITVPVMIEEKCLGALVAGEIIEQPLYENARQRVVTTAGDLGIDSRKLLDYFEEIAPWTEKRIDIVTRSLDAISNCFIEIGVTAAKNERTELEKHLREIELKALLNQINPHFLFNTLNTIEMLAMMEGARQTPKIVHSLAELFRHNLYATSDLVSIRQEMNSVNNYLTIQKCRFDNRIRVINKIPSRLMDLNIPVLTLQPLVENAVVHGLEPLEKGGCLKLEGYIEANDIVLQVIDNGIGISPKKLLQIQQQLNRMDSESNKIGLINVQKRCRLHFGPSYGISITSTPGRGTTVTLRLPVQAGKVGANFEVISR
ncbi:MAG TPA: histidine kinase [Desulfotomaculum sp.]|nr:histidine kinase [Desulfotomaculum sp.]